VKKYQLSSGRCWIPSFLATRPGASIRSTTIILQAMVAEFAKFIESSGIEVRVVKIHQRKIAGSLLTGSADFIDDSRRNLCAHGEFCLCEIARHGHEPAQREKIDIRLDDLMLKLPQRRIKIPAPQSAIAEPPIFCLIAQKILMALAQS
jgi:hypothetical protein